MTETLKIVYSDWKDDIDFEPYKDESKYDSNNNDGTLIDPNKVKNASIEEAKRKIGKIALFSLGDKLTA